MNIEAGIDYSFQKSVSYSQYLSYSTCPHMWYTQYALKKYDFKPTIHLVFGQSIHETLQHYFTVMYNASGIKADELDLENYFKDKFFDEYKKRFDDNNGVHFSSPDELTEFFNDGLNIIDWVRKKRRKYFSLRNMELVGIEIPLLIQANKGIHNVFFKGSIDIVVKDKKYNTYTIYDIKTSTRGWSPKDKKDPKKINQLLLYKKFFAKSRLIPEDTIDVKFFIVKRKIPKTSDFNISRIQEFVPAHGKIKMKKVTEDFNRFLSNVFNIDGTYIEKDYHKNVGDACRYCPFNSNVELCDKDKESVKNKFFVN